MSRSDFKKTIEYKEKMKLIKLIFFVWLIFNLIFDVIAVISYLNLLEVDANAASIVLSSIIIIFFLTSLPFLIYFINLIKKLDKLFKETSAMYVFEYELNLPIEHKYSQSRYLVTFNYKDQKYELMTSWLYDSNDLDNQIVTLGYVEKLNVVIVLSKK